MSFGLGKLDQLAAQLQAKAEDVLSRTSSTQAAEDTSAEETDVGTAKTGGKRQALRNVANIVKEQAEKGLGTSKEYISKVVEQVSTYANDASESAGTHLTEAKDKGITHFNAAKESANAQIASLQTNLNKAIAQGQGTRIASPQTNLNEAIAQGQGQAQGSDSATTTDRGLASDDEPLKFPFNIVAWCASICGGKGDSASTASTSKDFSIESLQNAAVTLTETLSQEAQSVVEQAKEAGESASSELGEAVKD